jgi:hypothetical protein
MAYCTSCGNSVSEEAQFCMNCGQRVSSASNVSSSIVQPSTLQSVDMASTNRAGKAMAGFVLGICSIPFSLIALIGFVLGILGIIFSAMSLQYPVRRRYSQWGLALSIIGTAFSIISSIIGLGASGF